MGSSAKGAPRPNVCSVAGTFPATHPIDEFMKVKSCIFQVLDQQYSKMKAGIIAYFRILSIKTDIMV